MSLSECVCTIRLSECDGARGCLMMVFDDGKAISLSGYTYTLLVSGRMPRNTPR